MKIAEIIDCLELFAPPSLQESYDNAGLLTGSGDWDCTGALVTLDSTEEVINEAIRKGCNLVIAHHPIIFSGLKKLNGKNYVEKTVIRAIKHDVAIYAIHTNLDNMKSGVNARIANKLGLINCKILSPKMGTLRKLAVYVPVEHEAKVRDAMFKAGGGNVGNYSECSFNIPGTGTFTPGKGTKPFMGSESERTVTKEIKIEVVFPPWLESKIFAQMLEAHPYEEVAYEVISLNNSNQDIGAGLIGDLPEAIDEKDFLDTVATAFELKGIRHSKLTGKEIKRIALCGGAGSFLINNALLAGADVYITSDLKYHEYFDANDQLLLMDIGHYESEQFTIDLLYDILRTNFPTFAIQKTESKTNPVFYHISTSTI